MKLFDLMYAGRSLGFTASAIGSTTLAAIFYQTSLGDFVYKTDSLGNIILDNQGPTGELHDGLLYSGRGIELGATNDLAIPIHHTLGADVLQSATFTNATGATGTLNGTGFTVVYDGVSSSMSRPRLGFDNLISGNTYVIDITSVVENLNEQLFSFYDGASYVYGSGTVGVPLISREIIFQAKSTSAFFYLGNHLGNATDTVVTATIKQITNPNSFLTYYDFTKSKFITLGNSVDGGSSEELVVGGTIDDGSSWLDSTGFTFSNGRAIADNTDSVKRLRNSSGLNLIQGNKYIATWNQYAGITSGATNWTKVGIWNGSEQIQDVDYINGEGKKTLIFTASATGYLYLYNYEQAIEYDNISCFEILPISTTYTFNNQTVNNILTHSTAWSALDFVKINNNPQLMAKLADPSGSGTIAELDMVLTASDAWYVASENEGAYVVDARAGYGVEIFPDPSFDVPATWVVSNATVSGGQATMTVTAGAMSYVYDSGINLEAGKYYVVTFDVASFTGTGSFAMGSGAGNNVLNAVTFSSSGITSEIYKAESLILNLGIKRTTVSGDYSCVINSYSVREATAEEISNYTSTIRTNVDFNTKGLQTTCLVLDGAGVPTAYDATELHFYGNGYVDSGYVLPTSEPFVVEFALDVVANGIQEIFGSGITGIRYRQFADNNSFIYFGGTTFAISETLGQENWFACKFDGIDNGKVYVNALSAVSQTIAGISSLLSFQLGGEGDGVQSTVTPLNHFKILTGSQATNYDATKAYNDYIGA